jgi:uncharacterized protein YneF (UPF0154 family)
MEFVFSKVIPILTTVLILIVGMAIAILVGNVSGMFIRKILGVGEK